MNVTFTIDQIIGINVGEVLGQIKRSVYWGCLPQIKE